MTDTAEAKKPRKRGRKPIGTVAMTPAERKRASRAGQRKVGYLDRSKRLPKSFSCDIDEVALVILRKNAKDRGVPIYTVLEQLIFEHLMG